MSSYTYVNHLIDDGVTVFNLGLHLGRLQGYLSACTDAKEAEENRLRFPDLFMLFSCAEWVEQSMRKLGWAIKGATRAKLGQIKTLLDSLRGQPDISKGMHLP